MKYTVLYCLGAKWQPISMGYLREIGDVLEASSLPPNGHWADILILPRCIPTNPLMLSSKSWPNLKVIGHTVTSQPGLTIARPDNVKLIVPHPTALGGVTATVDWTVGMAIIAFREGGLGVNRELAVENWDRDEVLAPRMISNATVGIMGGVGRIGRRVAEVFKVLGAKVRIYDPASVARLSRMAFFDGLDMVIICMGPKVYCPIPVTKFDIQMMNPGAVIVNTSRGEYLQTKGLAELVKSGMIRALALDVLEGEFEPGFHWSKVPDLEEISNTPHVLWISPHVAGSTKDARRATEKSVAIQIRSLLP